MQKVVIYLSEAPAANNKSFKQITPTFIQEEYF